jgi:serine/threonine-protein kinase
VIQACEAIAAAHAVGVVHRDLKPANLFLATASDGSPCVKVLDFGISKLTGVHDGSATGLTSTATIMGTPCFMSPEQLRSTRDVDARTDIWSIGAIVHALLTGAPPYDGESNADVSAKIIRDAPTPIRQLRPEAPQELEAIVLRCLEKEPGRRFADVVELAEALSSIASLPATKASAARVARIAAAVAPTVPSLPPPALPAALGPGAQGASDGPTRTASAWGDTRREERRNRRMAGMLAAAGVAAGLVVFGLLRWTSAPPSVGAGSVGVTGAGGAGVTSVVVVAPSSGAATATATGGQGGTVRVDPAGAVGSGAGAVVPAATGGSKGPGRAGVKPATSASAAPLSPPPAAKNGAGLFDGRE